MQAREESEAARAANRQPDFELKLLAWVDTLIAVTGLARIDFERTLSAAPQWVVLSLARAPVWLLFWLALSALLGYLVYAATLSVGWGLVAIVALQGLIGLLLELRLRALKERFTFSRARRTLALKLGGPKLRSGAYARRARKLAEAKADEFRERILRDQHMVDFGDPDGEREALKERVSIPLVGLSLVAGLVCGSNRAAFAHVLREPIVRDVLQVLGTLTEDFNRGHHKQ